MGNSVVRAGGDFMDFVIRGAFIGAAVGWVLGQMLKDLITSFIKGTYLIGQECERMEL